MAASTAATAIGIAGAASVLQSLLQCYKDFLVAREFGRDYGTRIVRLDILQISMKNWGTSVGLIDDSGLSQQDFRVSKPTEANLRDVKRFLIRIKSLFEDANKALEKYNTGFSSIAESQESDESDQTATKEDQRWKSLVQKVHRTTHRTHDAQHPGTFKRAQWALIDKERIDGLVDEISTLIGDLQTAFPPIDQRHQEELYRTAIGKMGLTDEELVMLKHIAKSTDTILESVADLMVKEHETGHSFKGFITTIDSMVNVGDFVADGQKRSGGGNEYQDIKTSRGSVTIAGNTFGGKHPLEIYMERKLEAAKAARG